MRSQYDCERITPTKESGRGTVEPLHGTKMGYGRTDNSGGLLDRIPAACETCQTCEPFGAFVPETSRRTELFIRSFDVVGSLAILAVSWPVAVLAGTLIKVTSGGPVLYRQERVGRGGRVFTLYKFRTMINGAERHLGPVWASRNDRRVTPIGGILRKMRIDELPQLYNILRGDMSLVGPRPERPFFVERCEALRGMRLTVKPGLTGLAQVRRAYDLRPEHKAKYDSLYIRNRSLWLNLRIFFSTFPVLFSKKGW